jgi:fructokinase
MSRIFGAVEAGGTKFVAAIFRMPDPAEVPGTEGSAPAGTLPDPGLFAEPLRSVRIPTSSPAETLDGTAAFFEACVADGLGPDSLGIGSFGPIDPDADSDTWGYITSTPKPGWKNTDIAGILGKRLGIPVGFDTDVNAAALAEATIGAGLGLDPVLYLTIGTGIGGGALVNGRLLHGLMHPEMGHIRVVHRKGDAFPGCCPYHGDCLEGMAAGPAVEKRWGIRGEKLPPDHPAWDLEAWYLAQGIVSMAMILSPQAVILGGGVMAVPGMIERVRAYADEHCAGYLARPAGAQGWAQLIRAPILPNPGLAGACLLAMQELETR